MDALAIGALALLLLGNRQGGKTPPKEEPKPNNEPQPNPLSPNGVIGKGIIGGVGALAGKLGLGGAGAGGVGGVGGEIGWTIPATIAGVSSGFLIVVGSWALAAAAAIVISALMAPEMLKRGTLARTYSAERGSYVWRAARLLWANIAARRLGMSVLMLRWPDIDTAWGELNVKGYLPVVLRQGEGFPANANTDYPDDIYEVYSWPKNREPLTPLGNEYVSAARMLAQYWALGFVSATKAAAIAFGDVTNTDLPIVDDLFTSEGFGLVTTRGNEGSEIPPVEESRAAWIQGIQDGLSMVRKYQAGFGGSKPNPNNAQDVAMRLVEWQPTFAAPKYQLGDQARFKASGRYLEITNAEGDTTSIELAVA